jgi:hypothetical protein
MNDSSESASFAGGRGIGWARASIAIDSASSIGNPELWTTWLSTIRPSWSMLKATRATPRSLWARASAG